MSEKVTCSRCGYTYVPPFSFDFYQTGDDPKMGLCERCLVSGALVTRKKPDPVTVPDGYETKVCRMGNGRATCKFLGVTPGDRGSMYACLKGSSLEDIILRRPDTMRSKGDNCSGPPDFKSISA